jgi:hypothetical protein
MNEDATCNLQGNHQENNWTNKHTKRGKKDDKVIRIMQQVIFFKTKENSH